MDDSFKNNIVQFSTSGELIVDLNKEKEIIESISKNYINKANSIKIIKINNLEELQNKNFIPKFMDQINKEENLELEENNINGRSNLQKSHN